MPGEFSGEQGRIYLTRVCLFLDGKFGFSVYQTAYEGGEAASIVVNGEVIRFDFLMHQKRKRTLPNQLTEEYRVHFCCECKWRSNPKDLHQQLRDFLEKALRTTPTLQRRFSDNYYFLFICNKPFDISQEELGSIDFLRNFVNANIDLNTLQNISDKIGILVLPDWFLETTSAGA